MSNPIVSALDLEHEGLFGRAAIQWEENAKMVESDSPTVARICRRNADRCRKSANELAAKLLTMAGK